MTNIRLSLKGAEAIAQTSGQLTCGMVGLTVQLTFDKCWEGLIKTLHCKSDAAERVVLNVGDTATVPPEVMQRSDDGANILYLGVEGRKADGTLVIPSTLAPCGVIRPGAESSADPSVMPESPAWVNIRAQIGNLDALETREKGSLVEAINELNASVQSGDSALWLEGYDIAKLYLSGDISAISKQNAVTLEWKYDQASGSCTLKWQGSSSLAYEKKNYTIMFDSAIDVGFGAQKKYCLKANYIDHSHARNIVSARIWAQMVKSRESIPGKLATSPNLGAIDGFPVAIVLNGKFHGLYTWNIPKDAWMMNMGSGERECILCANHSDAARFQAEAVCDESDFEIKYITDESSTAWAVASLNRLIRACIQADATKMDSLGIYLDWESAIDYYIFVALLDGQDMTDKNYILATYDGRKWFFSAYDMDSTFGLKWDASGWSRADYGDQTGFAAYAAKHRIMELIKRYRTDKLRARYADLRAGVLSEAALAREFERFGAGIPSRVLEEDRNVWKKLPMTSVNNVFQILCWLSRRLSVMDAWIANLPEQENPSVSTYTNQVSIATDIDGSILNGVGYLDGYRLNSGGTTTAQEGSTVTGFIPCTGSDIIRIKGVYWETIENAGFYCYIALYDSGKNKLVSVSRESTTVWLTPTYDEETGVLSMCLSGNTSAGSMAYIRLNAKGNGADMIVTINEEIK